MMTDNEKQEAAQFVANVAISKASRATDRAELVLSLQPVFEALGKDAATVVPRAIKEVRRRLAEEAGADGQHAAREALRALQLSMPGGTTDTFH